MKISGIHYAQNRHMELAIHHERISHVHLTDYPPNPKDERQVYVAPGLVDLQINGYGGLDLNTMPLSKETVMQVTKALWAEGITRYYPTIITNSDANIEHAVHTIAEACKEEPLVDASISGIHLEGPFISQEDGPRGAHDIAYVKAPDWPLFERWQKAASGRIRLVTLSPEWPEAAHFIRQCVKHGVTVAIGHTAATPEQIQEAVQAGATLSTHLGNGAHPMLPRHPHYIWEQLAQDSLYACCIADGFHLPDSVLKVIMRVKGERAILVSDAVYLCGMKPGRYKTHIGGEVILTPEGRLHLAAQPNLLAGSAQMLTRGIHQIVQKGMATLGKAWDMASLIPSKAMGIPLSGIGQGAEADMVLFTHHEQGIRIEKTIKAGTVVFARGGI